jgi:putative transposase
MRLRSDLHAYLGGTLKGRGCHPIEINTEPDHLHALFLLNQREHHRVRSFQEEFRAFLKAYAVDYDERYVWD